LKRAKDENIGAGVRACFVKEYVMKDSIEANTGRAMDTERMAFRMDMTI
jgi:hypothetical protein